jgi:hypothetical protein
MDVPVYKKLTDLENQAENPFGTKTGHGVVSISETFWARIARLGRPAGGSLDNKAIPNNSALVTSSYTASVDTIFYPKVVSVSCNVDAELTIQYVPLLPHWQSFYLVRCFAKAGTPVVLNFDGGEMVLGSLGGSLSFGALNSGAAAGVLYGSVFGYEVSANV